ncbi:MAG: hypothetical protein ACM3WV_12110 [Bacillota bacterium]
MFTVKDKAEITEIRLSDIETRLKNLEKGLHNLEEQPAFPGTLFQLEKALRDSCAALNWPVENELNADGFQRNMVYCLEALGRSILALQKRVASCESSASQGSGQIVLRRDILEKAGGELHMILQETLPALQRSIDGSPDARGVQELSSAFGRLFLRLSLLDNLIQCSLLDQKIFGTLKTGCRIKLKKLPQGEEFEIILAVGSRGDAASLSALPEPLNILSGAKKGDICELPQAGGKARYEVVEIYN